jgi:hypothetical protein
MSYSEDGYDMLNETEAATDHQYDQGEADGEQLFKITSHTVQMLIQCCTICLQIYSQNIMQVKRTMKGIHVGTAKKSKKVPF